LLTWASYPAHTGRTPIGGAGPRRREFHAAGSLSVQVGQAKGIESAKWVPMGPSNTGS
jgi:hypothetical protein